MGNIPEQGIREFAFADDKLGYLLGHRDLWSTEDGGKRWQELSLPSTGTQKQASFAIEPRYLGLFGDSAVWVQWDTKILHCQRTKCTIDAAFPIDTNASWSLNSMAVVPNSNGPFSAWLVGYDVHVNRNGVLNFGVELKQTLDGGVRWNTQRLPDFKNPHDTLRIYARSEKILLLGGTETLYYSRDGGNHWSQSTIAGDGLIHSVGPLANFFFLTDTLGWIGYADGVILNTEDSGRTWHVVTSSNSIWSQVEGVGTFGKLYFASEKVGVVLGGDGAVYKTGDGGKTWKKLAAPEFLHQLFCRNISGERFDCWAIGESAVWTLE